MYKNLYIDTINLEKKSKIICGIKHYVDKNNTKTQNVYSKLGMKESYYLFFTKDWTDV